MLSKSWSSWALMSFCPECLVTRSSTQKFEAIKICAVVDVHTTVGLQVRHDEIPIENCAFKKRVGW